MFPLVRTRPPCYVRKKIISIFLIIYLLFFVNALAPHTAHYTVIIVRVYTVSAARFERACAARPRCPVRMMATAFLFGFREVLRFPSRTCAINRSVREHYDPRVAITTRRRHI